MDSAIYRRLALEHKRKAEMALLAAEEQDYRHRRRHRALAIECLNRELAFQGASRRLSPRTKERSSRPNVDLNGQGRLLFTTVSSEEFSKSTPPTELPKQIPSPVDGRMQRANIPSDSPATRAREHMATLAHPPSPTPSSRSASFSSLEAIQNEFDRIKPSLSSPEQTDFAAGSGTDLDVPKLQFNSQNATVNQYDSELVKLLMRLDAVESEGAESVRGARRALVLSVESELERLQARKGNAWRKQQQATKDAEGNIPVEPIRTSDEQSVAPADITDNAADDSIPPQQAVNGLPAIEVPETNDLEIVPVEGVTSEPATGVDDNEDWMGIEHENLWSEADAPRTTEPEYASPGASQKDIVDMGRGRKRYSVQVEEVPDEGGQSDFEML